MDNVGEPELSSHLPSDDDIRHEIISRVYDVALDPTRLENLIDYWADAIGPLSPDHTIPHNNKGMDDKFIAEHFQRAEAVIEKLHFSSPRDEVVELLEQFDKVAAAIVSPRLQILKINPAASAVLNLQSADMLGGLRIDPVDRNVLMRQISLMFSSQQQAPSVIRVRAESEDAFIILHMRLHKLKNGEFIIIAVTSYLRWTDGTCNLLKDAFGLSVAEAEVVRLLVKCCNVNEIATLRGRSIDTVRAQIKAILAKTGARSQIELVRLTFSMMDIADATIEEEEPSNDASRGYYKLKSIPFQSTVQDDGRKLDYLILGDPNGKPCLFMPMEFGYIRWPASAEAAAEREGLKVIVPVRAGYGNSDPVPKGVDYGELVARDTFCVLDSEGIDKCPVITLGDDILFVAKMEQVQPGRISALVACGAALQLPHPDQIERMGKWPRFFQSAGTKTPWLLPFLLRSAFNLIRRVGKHTFLHSVYAKSLADVEMLDNPEAFEAISKGSEITISDEFTAHDAFILHTLYETSDVVPELIASLRDQFPIHCFNGLQDPAIHKDTLDEYRRDFPWITFHIYEDAGQLLFFKHWSHVLSKLRKYI